MFTENCWSFLQYSKLCGLQFLGQRKKPVQFTRSRAYHKDDNSHIEQKNWTHVRQWPGYQRFDNPKIAPLMNKLYKTEWRLFHNFFCPSVKLISKERIALKTLKRYDDPKIPYQRVMESQHVSEKTKAALTKQLQTLNPFELRRAIELKLERIFKLCYESKP
ncbi:MAG: hypothetical protein HY786_04030 [Deltaproteobacteria bacterium]|nr:hypothetical protein [Deltaproteobacteria bacterium]